MLFWHCVRAAAARTFWTAGSRRPMRMAMMAITTSSSISVKPLRRERRQGSMGEAPESVGAKGSGDDLFHDPAVDVGQAEVAAGVGVGQLLVVEAEKVQ